MTSDTPAIQIENLTRRYGSTDAVLGLNLTVVPGRVYGFFGRNGAGKTTTIKCLLNLLRPTAGTIRVFGLDPSTHEVAVKSRLAYVPDQVAFYPWMSVRQVLEYAASFRTRWNWDLARGLVDQLRLPAGQRAMTLSKGQRTQLALVTAIAAEPDLLVLDEPTSGLDPIVRREFIRTVIGAYQDAAPNRTVFVSTHLISGFEGLIDEFTIVDAGRAVLSLDADAARARFHKLVVRLRDVIEGTELGGARVLGRRGRDVELLVTGEDEPILQRLQAHAPDVIGRESLTLEEIFVTTVATEGAIV